MCFLWISPDMFSKPLLFRELPRNCHKYLYGLHLIKSPAHLPVPKSSFGAILDLSR